MSNISPRLHPTHIDRQGDDRVRITWSDGQARDYRAGELRDRCPCATCREKRSVPPSPPTELTVLSPEEARPLTVAGMKPVGNYAYNIAFSDGHDSGIFTFESLLEMGKVIG